uniref:NADH-ubiquinone oxidoreductase chain 4L n=1 Tax=Calameuta filiformis TaxID=222804 RepID=A0A0S1S6L4_9HYME|nr:NADH dehydrogenase subunit 4L [Calameuta filiformis]ALM04137.1 NADH dehydrogenase subunit 4L [Calameuta filiformis]
MLMFIWSYILILLVMTLMIFIKFNKHILLILMSLEFFVVAMFYVWFMYFSVLDVNQFISLYYLIFSVNESVLGLTIMIVIMRSEGSDYISSFSLFKW